MKSRTRWRHRGAAQLLARKVEGNDRALTMLIADEVDRIAKLIDQMQTLSRRTAEPVEPCNLHRPSAAPVR
jgi:two-component system nitrogen regulation sensor histidine kinase GlnL